MQAAVKRNMYMILDDGPRIMIQQKADVESKFCKGKKIILISKQIISMFKVNSVENLHLKKKKQMQAEVKRNMYTILDAGSRIKIQQKADGTGHH